MAGWRGVEWMMSKVWSDHEVACPSARRIAMPTASGLNPMNRTPGVAASIAETYVATSAAAGSPVRASLMASSASSGSRKKSPETATDVSRSSSTSTSAATSLPPATLYSPRMPQV